MELKELKSVTDSYIANFVNCLGLDGDYYVSCLDCPIAFGPTVGCGQFLTAGSKQLKEYLDDNLVSIYPNVSEKELAKMKKKYIQDGLIIISDQYKNQQLDVNLITTIIHETFHANRMILINTQSKPSENVESILTIDGHFVQTSGSKKAHYVDPNQDVIHGSVDTSYNAINKAKSIPKAKLEAMTFEDEAVNSQLQYYQGMDESLIELMTLISYLLISYKTNDVMGIIKRINSKSEDDLKYLTNIIIRHNDLDLIYWMIDPLRYQAYDINYDYLKRYFIDDDYDDLYNISDYIPLDFEDMFNLPGDKHQK